jgi:hypothetical protein
MIRQRGAWSDAPGGWGEHELEAMAGGRCCGSGGSKNQTTTTQTQLPWWLENKVQTNLDKAEQISERPYQAYEGDRMAPMAGLEQRGLALAGGALDPSMTQLAGDRANLAAGGALQGLGQGLAASGALSGLAGDTRGLSADFRGTADTARSGMVDRAQQFVNPYIENVENRAIANLERTGEGQRRQAVQRAAQAGAWGDRLGVTEGVISSETARSAGDLSAQLRSQGWQSALDQANKSVALEQAGYSGATGASQIAGQQLLSSGQLGLGATTGGVTAATAAGVPVNQQLGFGQAGLQLGGIPRQYEQALLDQQYADWRAQQDYPLEMLALRMGASASTPYGGSSSVSAPVRGPSPGASAAGGAMAGAAAGVPLAGATYGLSIPIGAIIGGAGGYLSAR